MAKTENILIRVSPNEKGFIKAKASERNFKNVSDFILSSLIYPERLDKKKMLSMIYEVNKIGVNLMQITRHVNTSKSIDMEVLCKIKDIDLKIEMVINTYRKI